MFLFPDNPIENTDSLNFTDLAIKEDFLDNVNPDIFHCNFIVKNKKQIK